MTVMEQEYINAVKAKNAVKMERIAWTGLVSDEFRIVTAIKCRCCELLKDDKSIVFKIAEEHLSNNRTEAVLENILYSKILSDTTLHNLALSFAYHVLPIYEAEKPNDPRPRNVLVAKEKWLKGEISDSELEKAREAAWAAGTAMWWAAGYAVEGVAYWAREAVKDSGSELQWQINEVLKVLK